MVSVFDIIPNSFFNPLSSNSNYRINAALLQFIYEQYDNEISYRIKRNILRDEVAYYISEHSEDFYQTMICLIRVIKIWWVYNSWCCR